MITLLHQAVDHSAENHPHNIAFKYLDQTISYAEIAKKANQLANVLLQTGLQSQDRVGILMDASLETAISVYGIWKAGGAYVPIDPNSPIERQRFVIDDCNIQTVLVDGRQLPVALKLLENSSLETIIGPSKNHPPQERVIDWQTVWAAPKSAPTVAVHEQDLAYIMYTSGSTGAPKGIMHTHKSGLTYAKMSAALYEVNADDVLSNHAPLHFDISTFDYFVGPLCGATTILIPTMYKLMPASLTQLLQDEKITFWYSVPYALIQALLNGLLETRDFSSLRWVKYGGEPIPPKYMRELQQLWPHVRFANVYGPAEVNQCSHFEIRPIIDDDAPIPIGEMCAAYEGRIVDSVGNEVADETDGELWVATDAMMQGYWNRPDLNKKAFAYVSLSDGSETKFYRTGDIVTRDGNDELVFLGRRDRLVKTRGYRVELDEIEAVLSRFEQVKEAAAFAVPSRDGSHHIHAVVVAADDRVSVDILLEHAAKHLPPYAVPVKIGIRHRFPRTGSGKIDRKVLVEESIS